MKRGPLVHSRFTLRHRAAGVLLHPTSLPGPHGSGDLGPGALVFLDFLRAAGLTWWQMLPISPPGPGDSPYSSLSALAGSPLVISLDRLVERGLLGRRDLSPGPQLDDNRVNYAAVTRYRFSRLRRAFDNFVGAGGPRQVAFQRYCQRNAAWLQHEALFAALRHSYRQQSWIRWPRGLRLRHRAPLARAVEQLAREIDFQRFCQYEFDRQWAELRRAAHARGVGLIGDIPIFVAHDSTDVWAHRELFDLDAQGRPRTVSGVPPDYFSRTGQLWGHPHYRWPRHKAGGFAWWIARFERAFALFDAARVDHFLGFHRVWAVPGRARTARHGRWVRTPGRALLTAAFDRLGRLEIIAEDLGLVTPQAAALRDEFGLPGMRLLQFAFGDDAGDRYNQPHTYPQNCVVYPGTHDNETIVGWFAGLQRAARRRASKTAISPRQRVLRYLGTSGREIHWDMIRLALMSPANTAIIPMQDVLGLDNRARMNRPATARGNWRWRMPPRKLTSRLARRLRELNEAYQRVSPPLQA